MLVIGRKELIEIPLIMNEPFVAKIDSGAYSNSIHCDTILLQFDGSIDIIIDKVVLELPAGSFRYKNVKSSNGQNEKRVTTKLSVIFNNKKYKTTFTFTNRNNMKSKVLLGRKFLAKRFIIDVSKTNLLKKAK